MVKCKKKQALLNQDDFCCDHGWMQVGVDNQKEVVRRGCPPNLASSLKLQSDDSMSSRHESDSVPS